jgi:hypothetical protein
MGILTTENQLRTTAGLHLAVQNVPIGALSSQPGAERGENWAAAGFDGQNRGR